LVFKIEALLFSITDKKTTSPPGISKNVEYKRENMKASENK
jgi:hypothetical protein